jgi:hypothetical protein
MQMHYYITVMVIMYRKSNIINKISGTFKNRIKKEK